MDNVERGKMGEIEFYSSAKKLISSGFLLLQRKIFVFLGGSGSQIYKAKKETQGESLSNLALCFSFLLYVLADLWTECLL
ncbi:MAG: hypothetical protein MJZ81_06415 [Bacteroidales bacterium]|nr:hypothetical protein [Bacteroidales bacterium]